MEKVQVNKKNVGKNLGNFMVKQEEPPPLPSLLGQLPAELWRVIAAQITGRMCAEREKVRVLSREIRAWVGLAGARSLADVLSCDKAARRLCKWVGGWDARALLCVSRACAGLSCRRQDEVRRKWVRARVAAVREEWVGAEVLVWWSGDERWYTGGVERVNGDGLQVRVCFDEPVGNGIAGARFHHWIRVVELHVNPDAPP